MTEFRLNRLLSKPLTFLLLKTSITPNQITTISLTAGLCAGLFFSQGQYAAAIFGSLLYQFAIVLDNCDGEVARAKNMKSRFGGWYDIVADFMTDIALFAGISLGALRGQAEGPVTLFTFLCLSGAGLHLTLVILEKLRGFGPAVFNAPHPEHEKRQNIFLTFFDALREGDSSWFVMLFALSGKTIWLLWFGGVYMQILWIAAVIMNFQWLFKSGKETNRENR